MIQKEILKLSDKINWSEKAILIIEDHAYSKMVISNFFNDTNARFICVSGKEGLKNTYCPIDVIIKGIDWNEMQTGLKQIRQIRAMYPSIPIIAHSDYAYEYDIRACYEAGCNEFITKPFDVDDLTDVLVKYFSR